MELFKKEIVNDKEELVKVEAYTKDELATEVEKLKDEWIKTSPMQKENDELKSRLNTIEKEKDIDFLRSFNIKKDLLNEFYENFKNDFKKCTSRQELDLLMHRISTEKPSYFESTKNKQSNKQDFDEYVNYDAKTKSFIF